SADRATAGGSRLAGGTARAAHHAWTRYAAPFQALRAKMETEWVPQMLTTLDVARAALPVIWDADFLYGPRDAAGGDTYVLCEINVSSCFAIPDEAPAAIAKLILARCESALAHA